MNTLVDVAFALLPLPVLITDRRGRITLSNKEARRVTGHPNLIGELLPRLCSVLGDGDGVLNLERISQRGSFRSQVQFLSPDGERTLFFEGCPVPGQLGEIQGFLFVVDAQHADSPHSPERQQKLELIGSIAGGVAHDLNNVLTSILGHIAYLKLSLGNVPGADESVRAIEDGAKRAASMTGQMLDFARGDGEITEVVNLRQVVLSGVNLVRAALPKPVSLSLTKVDRDLFVRGDEGQLSQIFLNLAVNAADALPQGGEIQVELLAVVAEGLDDVPDGEYVVLRVVDNGIGMSESVKEKIFQPFFTTKAKRGTGLGLANVFSLVRRHHGKITVDSQEGRGSIFSVYLPQIMNSAETAENPAHDHLVPVLPTGKELILIVEDEEIVRTIIQRSLEHLGYQVAAFENGREGIEFYRNNQDAVGLVILDMMMPVMSGDEVFVRLREINPHCRVLVASGYSSDVRARAVLERGGLGFIQKPFSVEELAREVRRCIEVTL